MRSYGDDTHYSDSEKIMNGMVCSKYNYKLSQLEEEEEIVEPVSDSKYNYILSQLEYYRDCDENSNSKYNYILSQPQKNIRTSSNTYKPKYGCSYRESMMIKCPNCGKYYHKNRYWSCPHCDPLINNFQKSDEMIVIKKHWSLSKTCVI